MTRRKWVIAGLALVALAIGAEFAVRPWNPSKGRVQVVNQGDLPVEGLVLSYGDSKVAVGTLAVGQSTIVWFSIVGKAPLNVDFQQKGNPMKGFQIDGFDPGENLTEGFKLMLVIKGDSIERYVEDDEPSTPWQSLKKSVKDWFDDRTILPW
jgi:hypothetical protein